MIYQNIIGQSSPFLIDIKSIHIKREEKNMLIVVPMKEHVASPSLGKASYYQLQETNTLLKMNAVTY